MSKEAAIIQIHLGCQCLITKILNPPPPSFNEAEENLRKVSWIQIKIEIKPINVGTVDR